MPKGSQKKQARNPQHSVPHPVRDRLQQKLAERREAKAELKNQQNNQQKEHQEERIETPAPYTMFFTRVNGDLLGVDDEHDYYCGRPCNEDVINKVTGNCKAWKEDIVTRRLTDYTEIEGAHCEGFGDVDIDTPLYILPNGTFDANDPDVQCARDVLTDMCNYYSKVNKEVGGALIGIGALAFLLITIGCILKTYCKKDPAKERLLPDNNATQSDVPPATNTENQPATRLVR